MGALTLQRLDLLQDREELHAECGEHILDVGRDLLELGFLKDAMQNELA